MISRQHKTTRKWVRFGSLACIAVTALLFCFAVPGLSASETDMHGAAHGAAHESKGWVTTDTYRVMNFVVLAAVLIVLLRKPAKNALNDRIHQIKNQMDALEAKKREAEAKLAEYSNRLASLDRESEKIVTEYIRQGEEAKSRIIAEARAAAEKIEAQARRSIQSEFKQAKKNLHRNVLDKALANAERMIKEKITAGDQESLIDDYLKKVVET